MPQTPTTTDSGPAPGNAEGRLRTRLPAGPSDGPVAFADAGTPGPPPHPRTTLAAHAGVLYATAPGAPLRVCGGPALPSR
ncbi:hypothetical protein ABZ943_44935 [Streptomyces rubiginosohelvolus]|uniref:hypothetical protein n=1 Tax=Streptomyces rubiginosohelvolus TaxID=67362 RepID=UPI0033F7729F